MNVAVRASLALIVCALFALALPLRARAQATVNARTAIARSLFEQGLDEASAGHLQRAKELFTRSREAAESVTTLLNLAIVCSKLGEWAEALAVIDDLEAMVPEGANDPAVMRAERLRADLAPLIATVRLELAPSHARVIAPEAMRSLRLKEPRLYFPSGERTLRVEAEGYEAQTRTLTLASGDDRSERFVLLPVATADSAAAPLAPPVLNAVSPTRVGPAQDASKSAAVATPALLTAKPDTAPPAPVRSKRLRRALWIGGAALVVAAGVITTVVLVNDREAPSDEVVWSR